MTAPDRGASGRPAGWSGQDDDVDLDATVIIPRVASDATPAAELEISAEQPVGSAEWGGGEDMDDAGAPGGEHTGAAGNSAIMAVGSLISRATGFLRTAMMAAALGSTAVGNAYTLAQIFPGMIYELLLGGILSSVLVPMLVRSRKADQDRGQAFAQRLFTLTVVALGIATTLATVCAPLLTMVYANDGTSAADRQLITTLSYLMLPTIFFYGLTGVSSAILNSRGHFASPMWTPILNNVVVIASGVVYLAVFGDLEIAPSQMTAGRILVLGGGVLAGIVVQALGLLPALRKVDFRWRWRFDFAKLGLRRIAYLGGWMLSYVIVNQLALLVMFRLLSGVGPDDAGPLIYNNVFLLLMMAHGIVAVSIITALLPRMSAAASDGRAADIAADLSKGIRMSTVVLAPIAVVYMVLALPISVALFERSAFDRAASLEMAPVLAMAGAALVPFAVSQMFNYAYFSMQDTKTPALINLPVASFRVAVQLAWSAGFAASVTAVGMMVGNGVSYLAAGLISAMLLRRRIGLLGVRAMVNTFVRVLAAAVTAAAAGWLTLKLAVSGMPLDEVGRGTMWLVLIAGGLVICGVYGGTALVFKVREVHEVLALVRRKIGR